ncbi:hypothetical protein [Kitasatospora sp. NPDC056531]|uniref:hypothetical protein n=1 Tax=Kitasatospora sp. NPDC056531 TaxID=3345856 RepID=UPI0036B10E5F
MRVRSMAIGRTPAVGAVTAGLALTVSVAAPATTASADPGFCGVRAGVNAGGDEASIIYTVRNKCADAHSFRVRLPSSGRESGCQNVPGYGYGYFAIQFADRDRQIIACS